MISSPPPTIIHTTVPRESGQDIRQTVLFSQPPSHDQTRHVMNLNGPELFRVEVHYDGSYVHQSYATLDRWSSAGFSTVITLNPQEDCGIEHGLQHKREGYEGDIFGPVIDKLLGLAGDIKGSTR
jgi:hypothetical protein